MCRVRLTMSTDAVGIWAGNVKAEIARFNPDCELFHTELNSTDANVAVVRVSGGKRIPASVLREIEKKGNVVQVVARQAPA